MKIILALLLALAVSTAQAEPWVISGQTSLSSGQAVDNPIPADSGVYGWYVAGEIFDVEPGT